MISRLKMFVRKLDVHAAVPPVQDRYRSSITHMLTVSTTPVADYFIPLLLSKTWSSTDRMLVMHLVKPLPQSKGSSSDQTVHSVIGGTKVVVNQSQRARLFQSNEQCKVTQKPHGYGRSTSMKSFAALA